MLRWSHAPLAAGAVTFAQSSGAFGAGLSASKEEGGLAVSHCPGIWGAPPSAPLPGPGQGLSPPPTQSLLRGPSAAQSEEETGRHHPRVNVKATEFLLQPPAANNQCGHAWVRLWPSVCLVNCCVPGTWVYTATVRSSSCPRRSHSFHETSIRPAQRFTEHLLCARRCSRH